MTPPTTPDVARCRRHGRFDEPLPLGLYIAFVGHRLSHLIDRQLAPLDLSRTQAMILRALNRHPGLMANDLVGPMGVEPPSVTRAVQSLERRGLVSRRPHPTDGRASLFHLTSAGEELAGEIKSATEAASLRLESCLTPEQRRAMYASLDALADRVEALSADEPVGEAKAAHHVHQGAACRPPKGLGS